MGHLFPLGWRYSPVITIYQSNSFFISLSIDNLWRMNGVLLLIHIFWNFGKFRVSSPKPIWFFKNPGKFQNFVVKLFAGQSVPRGNP